MCRMHPDHFFRVHINRSVERRLLDQRLSGLNEFFVPPPSTGWVKTVRQALGMSTFELATRMGLSGSRVKQLEQAEVDGTIRLSQLRRLGGALNCELHYVMLPRQSLDEMVRRQARRKAAEKMAGGSPVIRPNGESEPLVVEALSEEFHALVHELIDRRGLWR